MDRLRDFWDLMVEYQGKGELRLSLRFQAVVITKELYSKTNSLNE